MVAGAQQEDKQDLSNDDIDMDLDHQELLINGDLNEMLDQEIPQPKNGKRDKQIGGSTHVSSLTKSPLEVYNDKSETRHAFTSKQSVSQRSSFDDSFNESFNPFLSLNGTFNPRSISYMGEGLIRTAENAHEEQDATDIETILIE